MEDKIETIKKLLVVYIVERLAENFNISTKEALKKFIATDTYDLLLDNESFLYLESG